MACPPTFKNFFEEDPSQAFTAVAVNDQSVYATVYNATTNTATLLSADRLTPAILTRTLVTSPFLIGEFVYPTGLAIHNNMVYITVTSHQILARSVTAAATAGWSVFAGSLLGYSGTQNGIGTHARFNQPGPCCVANDILYVSDAGGTAIRAVSLLSAPQVTLVAGGNGPGFTEGPHGKFSFITSMCPDFYHGRLFVTDWNCIRQVIIGSGGSYDLKTLAGSPTQAAGDLDASGPTWPNVWNKTARFNAPRGLVVLNEGYTEPGRYSAPLNFVIYVADTNNNKIRRMDSFGNVKTLWALTSPGSMTVDKYGRSVYVSNTNQLSKLTVHLCGTTCVTDFDNSKGNCGGCAGIDGLACLSGQACTIGACACEKPEKFCPGVGCVNFFSDKDNCSACGKKCIGEDVCSNRVCKPPACKDPMIPCNHQCIDASTDAGNCGGCEKTCASNLTCVAGQCQCPGDLLLCDGGVCAYKLSDPQNCGTCNNVCPVGKTCYNGACICDVFKGYRDCDNAGVCNNIATDAAHCGLCNISCPNGKVCENRVCVTPASSQQCRQ